LWGDKSDLPTAKEYGPEVKSPCAYGFHSGEFKTCTVCKKFVDKYGKDELIPSSPYAAGLLA
jgi:hypothetical protein